MQLTSDTNCPLQLSALPSHLLQKTSIPFTVITYLHKPKTCAQICINGITEGPITWKQLQPWTLQRSVITTCTMYLYVHNSVCSSQRQFMVSIRFSE
jgi:hypothetical protein